MKFTTPVALAGLVAAATAKPVDPTAPKVPIGFSKAPFVKTDGRLFHIDGKTEYFAGTNCWWLAHLSKDKDIDISVAQMKNTGYKVIRVWGFGDVNVPYPATNTDPNRVYFQLLNSTGSYINYGADGLQRLDYAVYSAERQGMRLVLPFVNNWGDFGGINAYNVAFGSNATTWYTNAKAQAAYKAYIKVVVTRYKSSPAIFAWELGNEPRCKNCPTSVITKWATEISTYIKSLDPNHMVTLGDEGWLTSGGDGSYPYQGVEGIDFIENLKIKTLDYGTFHAYPESWGEPYNWTNTWIVEHSIIGKAAKKPVVLEEYGAPFPHNHTAVIRPWQATVVKNTSVAVDQVWQFGSNDLSIPGPTLGDVNTIYYNDTEYLLLARYHSKEMLAKSTRSFIN